MLPLSLRLETFGERYRVLDGLARDLPEVRGHRVRGVPEEGHAALVPALRYGVTVVDVGADYGGLLGGGDQLLDGL